MTVRDLVQTLLLESPNLDAEVYIQKLIDEEEYKDYVITKVSNGGTNDAIFIEIEDWKAN